jgi:hypothetical protein
MTTCPVCKRDVPMRNEGDAVMRFRYHDDEIPTLRRLCRGSGRTVKEAEGVGDPRQFWRNDDRIDTDAHGRVVPPGGP